MNRVMKKIILRRIAGMTYNVSNKAAEKRTDLYRKVMKIGKSCIIKSGCIITQPEKIVIGDGVSIQYNCYLSGKGGITIGNDVSLGNGTKIFTTEHPYKSDDGKEKNAFKYNKLECMPTVIGNNVITGADVIILAGVRIGDNVMIGAGSVVTKDVPQNSVYAGNPARLIKKIEY